MIDRDPIRFTEPKQTTPAEVEYRVQLEEYFLHSVGSNVEKLQNFAKYIPIPYIRRFLCRQELFKKILSVHGAIMECGVFFGGGLMTWAVLSEIYEPQNYLRNIVGFDTFSGFVSTAEEDKNGTSAWGKAGGLAVDSFEDLLRAIELYDQTRFMKHIPKVKLVRGDIAETAPQYLRENSHTVIALLFLDFDLFEPTAVALRHFVPRMPKGAIIAFDELNHELWPGETLAVIQELGLSRLRLERFPWGTNISFVQLD